MTNTLVSAICPIRDEEKNISYVFKTLRPINGITELIFVEGGSIDNSWEVAKKYDKKRNKYGVLFKAVKQIGNGKAEAVLTGVNAAQGKYIMIVDADLTVPQTELEKIFSLFTIHGDQIVASGNRLKGLAKPDSFYWLNYIGNYFFRYYYSYILQTSILDISCGTKAMTREMWLKVEKLRSKEVKLDKWGDIDWLYYGKRLGLSIKFANIHYAERLFDQSKLQNMQVRFKFAFNMVEIGLKILQRNSK